MIGRGIVAGSKVAAVVAAAVFVISCGGTTTNIKEPETKRSGSPFGDVTFIIPPNSAVGTSTGLDRGLAMELAADRARHELARKVASKLSGLLEQSAIQVLNAPAGCLSGHKYSEGITRTVHHLFLTGAHVARYWFNDDTGEVTALVTVDHEGITEASTAVTTMVATDVFKATEAQHQKLLNKMNASVHKEYTSSPVANR